MRLPSTLGTIALLAGFVVIWGTGYWPTEVADRHTETIMLSALRVAGGALLLVAFAAVSGARFLRGRMLGWAAGSGIVMILLPHWGTTEAVVRAGAGNAAVVVNAIPIAVEPGMVQVGVAVNQHQGSRPAIRRPSSRIGWTRSFSVVSV